MTVGGDVVGGDGGAAGGTVRGLVWRIVGAPGQADLTALHLRVPPGPSALLIHSDEHGANGIGPGTYAVRRKREWQPSTDSYALVDD